ncbi:hypothetical protein ACTJKC_02330 [Pedobacter sp. 22226]|uniref:hypothetical protein n=1 Tax=Pedobacter sp. 22226 TaxID=3453894 RepID=UPI003F834CCA
MTDFIAMIYEWFGYQTDLGTHLRGWDITCDSFSGSNLYLEIFLVMIAISFGLFALMYLIIDRFTARFSSKLSWWITALVGAIMNFGIAFSLPTTIDRCDQLNFGRTDLMLFGTANAFWGLVCFALLTSFSFPRSFSTNARLTTFWKP